MSVVGIDFGTLQTVVAVARNRGIDVITNDVSNRATPSLISFGEKQRYLGEAAKTQEMFNFKNTVACLKRLIGRSFDDPDVAHEKQFINANIVPGENGEAAVSVWYQNEQRTFNFTQLCAMYLHKIKEQTAAEIKAPVSDVVISVPVWFTEPQRRALLDAASIVDLNVLRLINDTTAAALGYGITKTDLPDPADANSKPRYVVFYDLGYADCQVAVVAFVKGKLIVKGTAYDRNLGGRDFDQVLVNHYIEEFTKKYKIDIASNAKAKFRLRQGCEKVKKILSANAVTMLNVECLMDDKDVSAQVERSDFSEWAASLYERLGLPIHQALAAANLNPEDVDFVELVGGSTRIPVVKQTLADIFGADKLSTTLNQDEAVARGCALQCAMVSPVFKVRDFAVQDWNGYPIEISWDPSLAPPPASGDAPETSMEAFPVGNSIPSSKILSFYRKLDDTTDAGVSLEVTASYGAKRNERQFPEGVSPHIGTWTLSGIKKLKSDDVKATIKVKTRLDVTGLVVIDSASQVEDVLVPVEEKKEDKKTEEGEGTPSPMEVDTPSTEEKPKTKRIIKNHNLQITPKTYALAATALDKIKAEEYEMFAADRLVIDTAEARNSLEEYVYETRAKLDGAWKPFTPPGVSEDLMVKLNNMEEWLYTEEGEEASKGVYVTKLNELLAISGPIKKRYLQHEELPHAEKRLRDYLNSTVLVLGDEKYSHIPAEELEQVREDIESKLNWLNDAVRLNNQVESYKDRPVTVSDMERQLEGVRATVGVVLSKKKEVKKEEPKKEETPAAEKKPEEAASANEKTEANERMDVD
ncbi:adenyl-nucleotide exchange factor sse1 [Gaertneriomyces sp. JEL0708]|nr:adenyl-nucleotide exchange factor sse1 [Gaertneriomyces sp. JEL0708]